jgi:tetratricopeptide (TPR) repeat protein
MSQDLVNKIRKFYREGNFKEVLRLVEKNLAKINDVKIRKEFLLYSSKSNYSLGNNVKAHKDILIVLEMIKDEEFLPKEIIEIQIDYGKILRRMGKKETALQIYLKTLEYYQNHIDTRLLTSILHNLANIYLELGNFSESEKYFQRILEIDKLNNDERGLALTYSGLASLNFYTGDFDKAIDYYSKSLDIRVKFKDALGIATISLNLGSIYANQIKEKDAAKHLKVAEEEFQKLGHIKGLHTVKNTRAKMFYFLKNYREVIENLEYIENIDESELTQLQCELINLLAESLILENQLNRAEKIVKKGLNKISDFDFSVHTEVNSISARMKQLLSQIKFKQGLSEEALSILNELEKTSVELDDEKSLISIYFSKAKIYTDERLIENALLFVNKAISLAERYKDSSLPILLDRLFGLNLFSGNYDASIKILSKLEKLLGIKNPYNILKRSLELIMHKKIESSFDKNFAQMNQESQILYVQQYLIDLIARDSLSFARLSEQYEEIERDIDNNHQYFFPYFLITMILSNIDEEKIHELERKKNLTDELPSLYSRILSKQVLPEEIRKKIDGFRKDENFEFNDWLMILDICFFSIVFKLHSIEVLTDIDWSVYSDQNERKIIKIKQEAYKQILTQESLNGMEQIYSKNMHMLQSMVDKLTSRFKIDDNFQIQKNKFMIVLILDLVIRTVTLVGEI